MAAVAPGSGAALDPAPATCQGLPSALPALPFGVFSVAGGRPRAGVRAYGRVLDLARALGDAVFDAPSLNSFLADGPEA